jgi:hypothetical protein
MGVLVISFIKYPPKKYSIIYYVLYLPDHKYIAVLFWGNMMKKKEFQEFFIVMIIEFKSNKNLENKLSALIIKLFKKKLDEQLKNFPTVKILLSVEAYLR